MATKFTPLHDRILIRRVEEAATTRGGIIIPDSAKDKPQEGEVISAGKGKINEEGKVRPLDVKEGDRILFGKYSGTEIKIDGEDFIIMREEEVLGILTGATSRRKERNRRIAQVTNDCHPERSEGSAFDLKSRPSQDNQVFEFRRPSRLHTS
jgi:chaperonin GroES